MSRGRAALVVAVVVLAAALAAVASLAANAATGDGTWPGPLDHVRTHAWAVLAVVTGLGLLAAGWLAWRQERPAGPAGDPPPPPAPRVPDWVVDRDEAKAAVAAVCARPARGGTAVGITTSLEGAGGFGKTVLATAVCADPRVRARFRGRVHFVTVGRDVRGRAAIADKVAEVTTFITGDTTAFEDPDLAGDHLGRLLDQRPPTLLVLDDVWEAEQLAPFLRGGRDCVRLVTTRVPGVLPSEAVRVRVDEMSEAQARAVLTHGLPALPAATEAGLLRATGRWALLLRLTNRLVAALVSTGEDPATAAAEVLRVLRARGPAAVDPGAVAAPGAHLPLDLDSPARRALAVRATVEAATSLLPAHGDRRLAELAVFVEDESLPVPLVAELWAATGGLTALAARDLCARLDRLSLISLAPGDGGRITLHDVLRDYLREELGGEELQRLHGVLAEAALPERWWEVREGYVLDHLVEHLLAAGRQDRAEEIAGDVRWVETRLHQRGPAAPWSDLARIPTPLATALARDLLRVSHLLTPVEPAGSLTVILHSRLGGIPHWDRQIAARREDPALRPRLVERWPLPDLPDPSLLRTVTGHGSYVSALAVTSDGTRLAVGHADGEVRLWDLDTGTPTARLGQGPHAAPVRALALAPDGSWAAAVRGGGVDRWELPSGRPLPALDRSPGPCTALAVTPDGRRLLTGHGGGAVHLWDATTGEGLRRYWGPTASVRAVAVSADGRRVAAGDEARTARVWESDTGLQVGARIRHRGRVNALALDRDGARLAAVDDRGHIQVTATAPGNPHVLRAAPDQTYPGIGVGIDPAGRWCVSAVEDGRVDLWDLDTGAHLGGLPGIDISATAMLLGPDGTWLARGDLDAVRLIETPPRPPRPATPAAGFIRGLELSPDGTTLLALRSRRSMELWSADEGTLLRQLTGHGAWWRAAAFGPDGDWLAATVDGDRVIHLWDLSTGTVTTGHPVTHWVDGLAVSPDGSLLLSRGSDTAVRLWDRATGAEVRALTFATKPYAMAFAPDGAALAVGTMSGQVVLGPVRAADPPRLLGSHHGMVMTAVWSPRGLLATGGQDGTVRLWDPDRPDAAAGTLTGHTGPVPGLAFSPDGRRLATAGEDGTLRIWHTADLRPAVVLRTGGSLHSCHWTQGGRSLAVGGRYGLYSFEFRP